VKSSRVPRGPRSHINLGSIYGIDTNVGQSLSFGTLITVRFGKVSKLFDPVQAAFRSRALFHADIGSDAAFLEPGQNLAVPIGRIGWHTFRHTYSILLHAYGTDMKVQQELLRHSDIRTTMNIYTHTVSSALREANSKVVRMVLPAGKTA
jgi:Phage integrase family